MSLSEKFKRLSQPICWLQSVYFFLKWNGMVCFNLSTRPPHATQSRLLTLYSLIMTVYVSLEFYIGILFFVDVFLLKDIIPIDSKPTLYTVSAILIVLSGEKSHFLFILQFWNRKKLMTLINEGFQLHNHILIMCKDVAIRLPATSKTMLRAKVPATLFQIAFLDTYTLSFNKSSNYNILLLVYSHWVSVMMSSTFFCGIFIVWQFYLILNQKLMRCMAEVKTLTSSSKTCQMRMQRFCDLSDEIDRLSCLYARCLVFTEQMNSYFSAALFMIIAYAFAAILSQLFFAYGMIARLVTDVSSDTSEIYACGAVFLFYSVDVYFIVSVSNEVLNAGREPGMMLYSFGDDIDERLNRSVS